MPISEDILIIDPDCCLIITLAASCKQYIAPTRLMFIHSTQACISTSATGAMGPGPPALLSSMSNLPVISMTSGTDSALVLDRTRRKQWRDHLCLQPRVQFVFFDGQRPPQLRPLEQINVRSLPQYRCHPPRYKG